MRPLLKYHLRTGSTLGSIQCRNVEIVISSYVLGRALREIAGKLKKGTNGDRIFISRCNKAPIIPYKAIPLSPEKIEEGKKIIERLKAKMRSKTETEYPLKRDPKTGRMMKKEVR